MSTLFTNGCSFTYGAGLQNPEEECYSAHLKNLMQFDNLINLGMSAGSNGRIVRTTLDYFLEKILNGNDLSNHTVVIQFTAPNRSEIYLEETEEWYRMGYFRSRGERDDLQESEQLLFDVFKLQTVEQELTNALLHVTALGNFFEKYNIKYMFVSMYALFHNDYRSSNNYRAYYEFAKQYNWYREPDSSAMVTMKEYEAIQAETISPMGQKDLHPNARGHAAIAAAYRHRLLELYP